MEHRKISLLLTVKYDSDELVQTLESIVTLEKMPDDIVISVIGDVTKIKKRYARILPQLRWIALVEGANRSVGRNRAIEAARFEHVLITDAGCILDPDWLGEMEAGFDHAPVVAGVAYGRTATVFERAQIPFVLPDPKRIDPATYLPATRAMGMTKKIWEKMGGFDERARYGEDYAFARKLQKSGIKIWTAPKAIVYWKPRKNLQSFARMLFEHAYGDAYNGVFRIKVALLCARMIFWIIGAWFFPTIALASFLLYCVYVAYKHTRSGGAWSDRILCFFLQCIADVVVFLGTCVGTIRAHALY